MEWLTRPLAADGAVVAGPLDPTGLADADLRMVCARMHAILETIEMPRCKGRLQRVADRLRRETSKVRTKVVEHGSASDVILGEAADPTTAIALATHGRGGLTRMIFGSVADKVVRGATGPVLVVRP